jgi:nucleoside-diphosphate-sugar epimerase
MLGRKIGIKLSIILVTGACGGIGSKLVAKLLYSGHQVIAIDDLYSGSWNNIEDHGNLTKITIDITDTSNLESKISRLNFDYCIHLAAISSLPECQINPVRAMAVNFLATVSLVEICARNPNFKMFIFASTSAVYEGQDANLLTEDMFLQPILVYPQTKFFSESYLNSIFRTRHFPIVNARLFNVFGDLQNSQRKSPPLINYLVRELSQGKSPTLFGWNAPPRDYISVGHVVRYFEAILESPSAIGHTFNICSGVGLTVRQIYGIVAKTLGSDTEPTLDMPERLWAAYDELAQGEFRIDPSFVKSETHKYSLGSPVAIQEFLGISFRVNHEEEISAIALKIRDNMQGTND